MFEGIAYAMGAPGGGGAAAPSGPVNMFTQIFPLILIFGIFYFLLIRPQQKKAKQHKAMLDNLKKGDQVITSGGLYGRIHSLTPNAIEIIIAEGVKVKIARGYIAGLAAPGEEAPEPESK